MENLDVSVVSIESLPYNPRDHGLYELLERREENIYFCPICSRIPIISRNENKIIVQCKCGEIEGLIEDVNDSTDFNILNRYKKYILSIERFKKEFKNKTNKIFCSYKKHDYQKASFFCNSCIIFLCTD